MELIILFFILLYGRNILNFYINKIDKNPTKFNLIIWFIIKIFILVLFIYYFDIIFYRLKEDFEIFRDSLNIFNRDLIAEWKISDEALQKIERLLLELIYLPKKPYKKPYYNIKLMLRLLLRDFIYYKNILKKKKWN